jgi:hypothetical protein
VGAFPRALREDTWVNNAGISGIVTPIFLLPTRQQIIDQYGFVDVATISVLPKPRDDIAPSKVYLRLYWSPVDKKWLPQNLIMGNSRGNRGPMLLF